MATKPVSFGRPFQLHTNVKAVRKLMAHANAVQLS